MTDRREHEEGNGVRNGTTMWMYFVRGMMFLLSAVATWVGYTVNSVDKQVAISIERITSLESRIGKMEDRLAVRDENRLNRIETNMDRKVK